MWFTNLSSSFSVLGQSVYNFFFSSDPDYQPLSAKPWHEAALAPTFWLATLQVRLDEVVAGIGDGSLASYQLEAACDDLVGMVASNTVKPTEFVYELGRIINAAEDVAFPAALTSLPNRLVAYLQADQAWALSCLQAELADGGISDQQMLVVLDFYRQAIDVRLFKPVVTAIIERADTSLRPHLTSLISQTGFQATPEAILAYHQWQAAQQRSGIDQNEKPVKSSGFARKLMSALGRVTSFLAKNPFMTMTGVLFAQSRLTFGVEGAGNNSVISVDLTDSLGADVPIDVLYGVRDMTLYSDRLSQGHKTTIPLNAFYIPGNANYELSLVGGGNLPDWISFVPFPGKILGSCFVSNIPHSDFGLDIEIIQDIVYVAGGSNGLFLFDASNPSDPKFLRQICQPNQCDVHQIVVDGQHAFIANGSKGFAVIDVSYPKTPQLIQTVSMPDKIVTGVEYRENTLFLTANGIYIYDVADPLHPSAVGNITSGQFNDIEIENEVAYLADAQYGSIQTFDISNPSAPEFIGRYLFLRTDIRDIEVANKIVYVATKNDGLQIINASNPVDPNFVAAYAYNQTSTDPVIDIELADEGRFAYITKADKGVVLVNTTTLSKPFDAGILAMPISPRRLDVRPDLIFVTDPANQGFWILRNDFSLGIIQTWPIADQRDRVNYDLVLSASLGSESVSAHFSLRVASRNPSFVSKLPALTAGIDLNNSFNFGVSVIDLDDDPVSVSVTSLSEKMTSRTRVLENDAKIIGSKVFFNQSTYGMALDENQCYLHLALGEAGLTMLSLKNQTSPISLAQWHPIDDEIRFVDRVPDQGLVLAGGRNAVYVLSVNDDNRYLWKGRIDVAGQPRCAAGGDYLYVVSETQGFFTFDMREPSNPKQLFHNATVLGTSIKLHNQTVYVVGDETQNLWALDMADAIWPSSVTATQLSGERAASSIAVSANTLAVVGDTIQVFSINDPTAPEHLNSHRLRFFAESVNLFKDTTENRTLAFISQGFDGLEILDVTSASTGIVPVYQYTSGDDNFNIMQIIFPSSRREFESYTALMSTGRLGLQIIRPVYGWYYSHMVMMDLRAGDQGIHQLQLSARTFDRETNAYQQLEVYDRRPILTDKFKRSNTLAVPVGYYTTKILKYPLANWVFDPDNDKLNYALTTSSGVLVSSNSRDDYYCTDSSSCKTPCLNSGFLSCTGKFADVGEYQFTLYVNDRYSGEVSAHIKVLVTTSLWNKFIGWLSEKVESALTIAALAVVAFLITLYYKVKSHVGRTTAEIIRNQLTSLCDNAPQEERDGRSVQLIADDIIEVLELLLTSPLRSIAEYQQRLDKFGQLCRSYILKQRASVHNSGSVTTIIPLWLVFERQLAFAKITKLLFFYFRNAEFDDWSRIFSDALLDLVRYSVLSIFATESRQNNLDLKNISMDERKALVGQLLQLASFSIDKGVKPGSGYFAVKSHYNVLMAADWARCFKMFSVADFAKGLVTRVFSVDIGGILAMFMMAHTHSAKASFMRSMRFSYESAQDPIEKMIDRKKELLADDRATYNFIRKKSRCGRLGQNLAWWGISTARGGRRFLFQLIGLGLPKNGGWAFHLAVFEKMLAAYEKNPTVLSRDKLREELKKWSKSDHIIYQKRLFFCKRPAGLLKPDPRNNYLRIYVQYLLDHLADPQALTPLSTPTPLAGAGAGAGGGARLTRQMSDRLLASTILPPGAPPPKRPKLLLLQGNCCLNLASFFCCSRPTKPTDSSSARNARAPAPNSPPVNTNGGYVALDDDGEGVEMKQAV